MASLQAVNQSQVQTYVSGDTSMQRNTAKDLPMRCVPPSPLTQTVWKDKQSTVNGDVAARLTWTDLYVTATNTRGETLALLNGLNGYAEPGGLMAIMGPSGSGKSTLLDALAGRLARNLHQAGEIRVNGHKKQLSYGMAAYVAQDDVLIGTLTVRETITYSAMLRLPDLLPQPQKQAIIDSAIAEMGLRDCADTSIGNWHLRGLSGGEKRRVSIALEILIRPRLLFLDEPTSGLDSASAFFVIGTLRNLARDGRTVVASIHQPSSEVFELFDKLFLLSHGRTMYFGEASGAQEFFAAAGFPCPSMRNPSDHFLRVVNSDFDAVRANLRGLSHHKDIESAGNMFDRISVIEAVNTLAESYQASNRASAVAARIGEINKTKGVELESAGSRASFWMQTCVLTKRSFTNMFRDMGYYWLRLVIYVMLTLCVGTIFFRIGTSYNSIMARAGCMSFVSGFLTFMSIGGFPSFVEDMKVFLRERLNGHYGVLAFVFANSLSSLPFLVLISVTCGAIAYYMIQLHPGMWRFAYFVLSLFASLAAVEGLMMAVASVVSNFLMGIITGAGILGLFLLLAGFFRLPDDLPKPVWRYPLSFLGYNMFSYEGCLENDFLGLEFENRYPGMPTLPGELILKERFEVDVGRSKWVNLGIIFSMVVIYRLLFFIMIKFGERVRPVVRALIRKYTPKYVDRNNCVAKKTVTPETEFSQELPIIQAFEHRSLREN